ncbi:DUF6526 family protein [Metabacillus sp. GX 13764]|uniref:DUF6526 family protein n=1 Tax=Metabacillus kandeliae TaxID=2900151 RepID=UPI001E565580|nr:DUF6526 family protein [Metabacillus kandeliae]MCD7034160.1 DUF6526 family protein [Metabacillus kandeliae]
MENQDFNNHTRVHPLYHYVLTILVLAVLVSAIVYAVLGGDLFAALFMFLVSISLILILILVRTYPLKAQDRAIRAEENLRHYVLTGKLLNPALSMKQIVALRFASDEELQAIAEKAAAENLSAKDIKQNIQSWKADLDRI